MKFRGNARRNVSSMFSCFLRSDVSPLRKRDFSPSPTKERWNPSSSYGNSPTVPSNGESQSNIKSSRSGIIENDLNGSASLRLLCKYGNFGTDKFVNGKIRHVTFGDFRNPRVSGSEPAIVLILAGITFFRLSFCFLKNRGKNEKTRAGVYEGKTSKVIYERSPIYESSRSFSPLNLI